MTGPSLMEASGLENSTGAIRAASVECDLVPVRDKARLPLDLQDQVLHELPIELDDGTALLAAGVVVYTLGRQLVARVTLAEIILAHDAELGEEVQRPVDRGEAEIRVVALDPVVDLLGREMPLSLQLAHDDATLVG